MKGLNLTLAVSLGLTPQLVSAGVPAVQGTQQLKGGDGVIGQTYTLYPGTVDALNFTLGRLEYLSGHFLTDPGTPAERDGLRPAGKKLLIVHFTAHNPQGKERSFNGFSVFLSGVDSNGKTVRAAQGFYDEKTLKTVSLSLKPAQKINVVAALELDSRASLPKLLVETNRTTHAVWRYDLNGKVAPVIELLRDPKVPDGSAALDTMIPGRLGVYYPGKELDFRVRSVQFSAEPQLGQAVPAGGRLLLVNLSFRNVHQRAARLGNAFPPVRARVFDQDDLSGGVVSRLFLASRDQPVDASLDAGKEVETRLVVSLPAGMEAHRLQLEDVLGRTFTFDLGAAP